MLIKIDCREKELIKQVKHQIAFVPAFMKLKVQTENLPLGDIIFVDDTDKTLLIIERKSIPDLLSSLKDGRYEEQSYRLSGCDTNNHNIIYLIEGDPNLKKHFSKIDKLTFYSTMVSLSLYKGYSVFKTLNMTETALFICNCAAKIIRNTDQKKTFYFSNQIETAKQTINSDDNNTEKDDDNKNNDNDADVFESEDKIYELSLSTNQTDKSDKDYIHVVKKIKKENITVNNIDELMLCQIPGVSSTTAIAVIKKFESIKNMVIKFTELKQDISIDDKTIMNTMFGDVKYLNCKGNLRKISKVSINNLHTFLLER